MAKVKVIKENKRKWMWKKGSPGPLNDVTESTQTPLDLRQITSHPADVSQRI